MPDFRPVLYILGLFVSGLGATMVVPALVDAALNNPDWEVFVAGALICLFVGGTLVLVNHSKSMLLDLKQGFLLTAASWIALPAFAAVPFTFGELDLRFVDAYFEAVSGLTTTGSTILVGLDHMPPGILLWRALLQWVGGLGIIAMAIAMLPFLRVGGMQLFRMESSDRSAKILPRPAQIVGGIGGAYLGLSALCAACYWVAGMDAFEAITHAMTTLSTGGFSTSDSSLAYFDSAWVDAVATIFMLAGGIPFVLYVQALRGEPAALWRDPQVRALVGALAIVVMVIVLWLWLHQGMNPYTAFRHTALNVVSVVTTTGFASTDYSQWGGFAVLAFFFLTFAGGCTGSTSGGIKVFRFLVGGILLAAQIKRLAHPNTVFVRKFGGRPLGEDVIVSVSVFIFLYVAVVALLSAGLSLQGLDFITAASGAATAVSNVGPGLGPIIGPVGNFQPLPDGAKWLLSLGMLLGRLEFFTILVLLTPAFWRG
ncbi:trk system potassium uptake protein TrkH [Constrictibacter sp. MBR-5]|jgi:trk system potassium uptake protein TrkH|uniref:TrkH family potassium uptake protein n=1 Tax=Constrictibacter sp. MBR-5 TaxID=3156467 RepID=UPI003393CFE2